MGTEFCGLPRIGVVSLGVSHGSCLGCSLKSVNQEQAPSAVTTPRSESTRSARMTLPLLPLISHLERAMLAEDIGHFSGTVGAGGDPHAVVAMAEARVVANRHGETWNAREREHAEHRR